MDFSDGSSQIKISSKQLAIIAGGIILAIVIVVVSVRLIRGKTQTSFTQLIEDQRSSIEKMCDLAENPQACLSSQLGKAAVQTGNVELCAGLNAQEYDGCVWETADTKKDPLLCESIADAEKKVLCADTIYISQALELRMIDLCDKIQETVKQTQCREAVFGPVTIENCASRGKDVAYCQALVLIDEARQKQDRRPCQKLSGDYFATCTELVEIDDPDFDGLDTSSEIYVYKSNPDKADTDGDGFRDGDEVQAGYNPSGPGKLK